jgi:hypothetical protein
MKVSTEHAGRLGAKLTLLSFDGKLRDGNGRRCRIAGYVMTRLSGHPVPWSRRAERSYLLSLEEQQEVTSVRVRPHALTFLLNGDPVTFRPHFAVRRGDVTEFVRIAKPSNEETETHAFFDEVLPEFYEELPPLRKGEHAYRYVAVPHRTSVLGRTRWPF